MLNSLCFAPGKKSDASLHTHTGNDTRANQILFHFDFATMCRGQGHSSYVIIYGRFIHWFVQLSISFEIFGISASVQCASYSLFSSSLFSLFLLFWCYCQWSFARINLNLLFIIAQNNSQIDQNTVQWNRFRFNLIRFKISFHRP